MKSKGFPGSLKLGLLNDILIRHISSNTLLDEAGLYSLKELRWIQHKIIDD
jgi:hypothetical protein